MLSCFLPSSLSLHLTTPTMAQISPQIQTDTLQGINGSLTAQVQNGFTNADLYGVYDFLHQNCAGGGVLYFHLYSMSVAAL